MAVSGVCSGVLEANSGKIAATHFFPNREMLQILGFGAPGKANLLGTLGVHTARTFSPPPVRGVF